jgi:hypothetical protein
MQQTSRQIAKPLGSWQRCLPLLFITYLTRLGFDRVWWSIRSIRGDILFRYLGEFNRIITFPFCQKQNEDYDNTSDSPAIQSVHAASKILGKFFWERGLMAPEIVHMLYKWYGDTAFFLPRMEKHVLGTPARKFKDYLLSYFIHIYQKLLFIESKSPRQQQVF